MGAEGSITGKTDIDIVNTALIQLGQSPISAFGQNTGTGIILQSSYNISRDDLLRQQPWSFAKIWASLAQLAQVPLNLDLIPPGSDRGAITFTAAFQLPNDCLRVFRFSPKDATWRIVGRAIYTDSVPPASGNTSALLGLQPLGSNGTDNQPGSATTVGAPISVGIEYISQIVDPNAWDFTFISCFVWKLMKEMAFGVTGLMQAYQMAKVEFDEKMKNAAAINGLEAWPDPFWCTDLVDVRLGYAGAFLL